MSWCIAAVADPLAASRPDGCHRAERRSHHGGGDDAGRLQGQRPGRRRRAERSTGAFADLASKYVEQHAKKHNKSWAQADALVRRFALPRWGKLQAASVTRGDVKTMMAKIAAPIVANQTLAAVSAIFSWGIREELVSSNPCN